MFGTRIANRTARGMAVGALILSISATTFAGSANAAPLADEKQDCSSAAHARNDAVHLLHTAWKVFNGDLKDLAHDARMLQHESHKSGMVLTKDAREEISNAKQDLKEIASQAHEDIQAAVELGSACKDANEDEDTTTTTTTTTTTNTSTTAPSDSTPPADSTGSAHSFDTSGLDAKYKDIVDQAIKDMQGVVDGARKALLDMTAVVESKETNDDSKVEKAVEAAKADREKAKEERVKAKDERENAKKSEKNKATTKSQNSGKGNGKAHDRGDHEDSD